MLQAHKDMKQEGKQPIINGLLVLGYFRSHNWSMHGIITMLRTFDFTTTILYLCTPIPPMP
jgi:hypothetical protein